jgi:hypothetical protein
MEPRNPQVKETLQRCRLRVQAAYVVFYNLCTMLSARTIFRWGLVAVLGFAWEAACQDSTDSSVEVVDVEVEDPCAQDGLEDYNLGLHIGAVFILLGVSLFGSLLPVMLGSKTHNSAVVTSVK